jgi:2-polyprenyl-3-methyl-5-hydroxy-6-metoxy-1,4-benzoquinol methylase
VGVSEERHICPYWVARFFLSNPLRKLLENPGRLLGPHVHRGATVLDLGCALGFFTLPLARLVGPEGRVIALDVQQKMIEGLQARARRSGLAERIDARLCEPDDLGLADMKGGLDFAAALHVLHEMPDVAGALRQLAAALKPGASLLVVEPAGHVSAEEFAATLHAAENVGLQDAGQPRPCRGRSILLRKPAGPLGRGSATRGASLPR